MAGVSPSLAVDPVQSGYYDISPGLLGFLVVFAIGVALAFLLRSMMRHLGRVDVDAHARERTGDEPGGQQPAPPAG